MLVWDRFVDFMDFEGVRSRKLFFMSKIIYNLLNTKPRWYIKSNAGVFYIICNNYKMKYKGETARNLKNTSIWA